MEAEAATLCGFALVDAIRHNAPRAVRYLIKAGADVNIQDDTGRIALVEAAKGKKWPIMMDLINAGADVNVRDIYSDTALMFAAVGGEVRIVSSLLKAGADINAQCREMSALSAAVEHRKEDVALLLIKSGADVNVPDHVYQGTTALMRAAKNGMVQIVDALLESGADVHLRNYVGETALLHAVWGDPMNVHVEIIRALVKAGADVNIRRRDSTYPETAVMWAVHMKRLDVVNELIKAGADVNDVTWTWYPQGNFTPVMFAAATDQADVVKALLKSGAKINLDQEFPQVKANCKQFLLAAGQKFPEEEESAEAEETLQELCKKTIRHHLLNLDPHSNLFDRIPRLPLPTRTKKYLLYNMSLNSESE